MGVPTAADALVQANAELVLVVDRPPPDQRSLRRHMHEGRIDALPPGKRPARQGIRESRAHQAVAVGRVDEHADGQRGHGSVAHSDPGRVGPPDGEYHEAQAERDQPSAGAGIHDGGPEQTERGPQQPAAAHQRPLQSVLQREQRDEAGPENHGAVVRVLAERGDSFATTPFGAGGAGDPQDREHGPRDTGEREDGHGLSPDLFVAQEVVAGPPRDHPLDDEEKLLDDLVPVIGRDQVGRDGVAAVDRGRQPVRVEVRHEAEQRCGLAGVTRARVEQRGEQEQRRGQRRNLDRERAIRELERDRADQEVERPAHDGVQARIAAHRILRASSRPRRSMAARTSPERPVTSARLSTTSAVAATPPTHVIQCRARIRLPR